MATEEFFDLQKDTNSFNRASLELTFKLLRPHQPTLALCIQNILTETRCINAPYDPEELISLEFEEQTVADIVDKLAEIGQSMSQDSHYSKQDLIAVRCLLMDWLIYAQSFLGLSEKSAGTPSIKP